MSYINISLPADFVLDKIDPHIGSKTGYQSRAEIVKEAVRDWLQKQGGAGSE